MASIQDFRRSVDRSLNSHPQQRLPVQSNRPNQTYQPFTLANRRSSDPYTSVVREPAANPMLKLMEERMASAAALQKEASSDKPVQAGPVSLPIKLEDPAVTPEQQAALLASINKWAGIDNKVKSQAQQSALPSKSSSNALSASRSFQTQKASLPSKSSSNTLSASRSFHKIPIMPSVCENNALNSSFTCSQPLSSRQHEILQLLLLEQRQENLRAQASVASPSPSVQAQAFLSGQPDQPSQTTTEATQYNLGQMTPAPTRNGLERCAVSLAEVDRLRQENQAIQLLQQQALQNYTNEQFYLHQRSLAESILSSLSNQSINALQGSHDSFRQPKGVGCYRKRNSKNLDDDDDRTSCTSSGSLTGSRTSCTASIQSHNSFSSKTRRTSSYSNCTASMENLRINNGDYTARLDSRNQSITDIDPVESYAEFVFRTGERLNQNFSSSKLTRKNSLPSDLHANASASSAGDVKAAPCRRSSFVHSLLSAQSEIKPPASKKESPRNISPNESRKPPIGIDHNLSGHNHCAEKMIMSDLPDRILYRNAEEEPKPMDIVTNALERRGIKTTETKAVLDMSTDFFVEQSTESCQEAVDAIRANDVQALQNLYSNGTNFQCANKFGESLIHLACRRSHRDVVSFLINEAGVSLRVRDDFGRTPFHDACWRGELDLELIDMLLDKEPTFLMLTDKRGHCPLDYTRRGQWAELIPFLLERSAKFQPA